MNIKICPTSLIQAAHCIANNQLEKAKELLTKFEPESVISDICKKALLNPNETTDHLFLENEQGITKQINIFDTILKRVPCVAETTNISLQIMKDFYLQASRSFTHINIGIGKGLFEKQLLTQIAKSSNRKPYERIKIIGLDIDPDSLMEAENNFKEITSLFDKKTLFEFVPVCEFAEKLPSNFWIEITQNKTEITGATSSFTLHHLQTIESRNKVLRDLAKSKPQLFTLIEPDSDHFSSYLPDRLVSCWNLFGAIFDMADKSNISKEEEYSIKYVFFGREIENILSINENQRYEKHDLSSRWMTRLREAGFTLIDDYDYTFNDSLLNFNSKESGLITAEYNCIPLVSVFTATT